VLIVRMKLNEASIDSSLVSKIWRKFAPQRHWMTQLLSLARQSFCDLKQRDRLLCYVPNLPLSLDLYYVRHAAPNRNSHPID
jgi:hypothetical protein